MKKTFKVFFSLIIILAVASSVIQVSAASVDDNKTKIYKYLTGELSFNSAAACGIMANMEHESRFDSTKVARDSNGLLSGGLCMWNGSRFSSLQTFCNNNGYNYLGIAGQLEYLAHELKKDYYSHIYRYLKNVSNTSSGAADAAYYWCYYFEIPGNRSYQAQKRASSASSVYWPKYGNITLSAPKISSNSDGKKIDLGKNIKLTLGNITGNASKVTVLFAEKKSNGYDWSKAKTFTYSPKSTSVRIPTQKLGIGEYAVRAYTTNSYTDKKSSNSNTLSFRVACIDHEMKLKKETSPTFKKSGSSTYICTKCGLRETVIKDKLSKETIENSKVNGLKISKKTADSVTLSWEKFDGASSYLIYQKSGDEWVKIKTVGENRLSYTVKELKSATGYSFKIVACVKDSETTCYSSGSTVSSFTRPKSVRLTDLNRYKNGKVSLSWTKVKAADGYTVYASTDPNSGYKAVKEVKSDKLSANITELKSGTYYYFYVKSFVVSESGHKIYSDNSNVKFALTL